jgi:hypothetical protein
MGEAIRIAGEAAGRGHRLGRALRRDGNHMASGTDVDPCRTGIYARQRFGRTTLLGRDRFHGMALDSRNRIESRDSEINHLPVWDRPTASPYADAQRTPGYVF